MKTTSIIASLALGFTLAAFDVEAARRFGGGGNLGKQRAAPTAKEAPSSTATAPPPSQAAPAPASGAPAATGAGAAAAATPKPTFFQRWGGVLAGLGIGALLAGLFGAQMGPVVGLLLAALLGFGLVYLVFRFFAGRRGADPQMEPYPAASTSTATEPPPAAKGFQGIGSAVANSQAAPAPVLQRQSAIQIPGFEVGPFVRVAKTSFIRLQAANDSGDLDDIRNYTTPELYGEIAAQLKDRGPQKTEVVSLDADVIEAVVDEGYEIASVRFWGLIRENDANNPEPFDETWHVRRQAGNAKAPWLISGIQQQAA